jgi:dTDP-4-amino-4,6-dideoxy-D-galactose acyltransferase
MTKFNYLEWDSSFFELKIYQANISTDFTVEELILEDYDLIYLMKSSDVKLNSKDLEPFYVDTKLDFEIHINESLDLESNSSIVSYLGKKPKESLDKLAIASGVNSRFKKDPKLNFKFNELYQKWIRNSLSGDIASEVFVCMSAEQEVGLITVKLNDDHARIGIIAVDNKCRGQGIGKKLLHAVKQYCIKNKIYCLRVATQKENLGAVNFYEKNSFSLLSSIDIYHFWRLNFEALN